MTTKDEESTVTAPDIAPMGLDDLLLWQLAEECAEVVQAISKAQRFGLDEDGHGQYPKNRTRVVSELRDVIAVVEMLQERGVLGTLACPDGRREIASKKDKVLRFAALSCREGRLVE